MTLSSDGCTVVSGVWRDYFTGAAITDPSGLDIDHMVPLANAHGSGGAGWAAEKKRDYANDLSNAHALVAVSASANRSKGSRSADQWKPSDTASWCWYAGAWVSVKAEWNLTVTASEKSALAGMLTTC